MFNCSNLDTRQYFLCGMRLFFGVWLLYVGMSKWVLMGADSVVGYIVTDFDKTWSPHMLNVFLAWLIVVAEPVLALGILSGKKPRCIWMLTSMLMFLLMIGQTILMKSEGVIGNWHYVVLTLVCAAMCKPDEECCSTKQC